MGVSSFKVKLSIDSLATIIGAAVVLSSYLGLIAPKRHGFYCNDSYLNFDYNGDSLGLGTLFAITFLVPMVVIGFTELHRHQLYPSKDKSKAIDSSVKYHRSVFWKCYILMYRTFLNGLVCTLVIVEFLKIAVGGLRPHFFYSCQPDFNKINCSEGYVTEYECTKVLTIWHHSDIFKSFPSGHAALAMYMSLFLCFYIHKQLVSWPSVYMCSVAQSFLIFWAVYCGCSRMTDHRHHWWDVLTGAVIGAVCSCHSAFLLCEIPPLCETVFPLQKDKWSKYERPQLVLPTVSQRFSVNSPVNQEESLLFTPPCSPMEDKSTTDGPSLYSKTNHFVQLNSSDS